MGTPESQSLLLPPNLVQGSSEVRSRAGSGRRARSEACREHIFSRQSPSACGTMRLCLRAPAAAFEKAGKSPCSCGRNVPQGSRQHSPKAKPPQGVCCRTGSVCHPSTPAADLPAELISESLELPSCQPRTPESIPAAPHILREERIAPTSPLTLFKSVSLISL